VSSTQRTSNSRPGGTTGCRGSVGLACRYFPRIVALVTGTSRVARIVPPSGTVMNL
jgi:hypothetical protein